jgi:hypothetical protein
MGYFVQFKWLTVLKGNLWVSHLWRYGCSGDPLCPWNQRRGPAHSSWATPGGTRGQSVAGPASSPAAVVPGSEASWGSAAGSYFAVLGETRRLEPRQREPGRTCALDCRRSDGTRAASSSKSSSCSCRTHHGTCIPRAGSLWRPATFRARL